MDRETAALLGLPYEEEGVEAPLSGLGYRDLLRKRLQKDIEESETEESQSFQTVLNNIELAKQRLLAQPSRQETLQQIASKLTQPRERTDPRFFERRNLYTFLRDIGEYGSEREAAQKKAQEQAAKLDELSAKYKFERAQERGSKARQLMAQYLSKEEEQKNKLTNEVETANYYQNIVENPDQFSESRVRYAREWLAKNVRIPPEKAEPDPDRPNSIVVGRVSAVSNRELGPIKARLNALNETRAAIANARTNPAQVPQVDRFFARLSGDSQLSQLEVNEVANSGAFPSRVANQVSKFLTGSPTDLSLDQKAEVLDVLEKVLGPSFNSTRNQIISRYGDTPELSSKAVERIVGPSYITAKERRRREEEKKAREDAETKAREQSISTSTGKQGRRVD